MKIRNGFVSNSSSSSFVIIAPADYNYLDKVSEKYRDFLSKSITPTKTVFMGNEVNMYKLWRETDCGEGTLEGSDCRFDVEAFWEEIDNIYDEVINSFRDIAIIVEEYR